MYQTGCNAYRHSAGNTIEDNRVVLLKLYSGALKFMSHARRGIQENSAKIRGENISKAMDIISELDCALDTEKGGALSHQLGSLYRFAMEQLTDANRLNDLGAIDRAESVIMTLKDGFQEALHQQKNSATIHSEHTEPQKVSEGVSCAI